MQTLLLYVLKVILCAAILLCYYWIFLRNRPFHSYNRFYLLCSVIISLCLPLIKIDLGLQVNGRSSNLIQLLQAIPGNGEYNDRIIITAPGEWNAGHLFVLVYFSISLLLLLVFSRSVYTICKLVVGKPSKNKEGVTIISSNAGGTPFSFLHFIFWNNSIDIESSAGRRIFKHEMVHVRQKHSYDKIFINLVIVTCWCNPFFWLIKKELAMIHEFIADSRSVDHNDTNAFAAMILQAAYPGHNSLFTNNFFHSPIKRRLTMITKNNYKAGYISRMLCLPLFFIVSAAFTFKIVNSASSYRGEKTIVVIDAGHGGNDAGAKAADGTLEKDIVLALAQKVKTLNKNNTIEIILSRNDDTYQSPQERIQFATGKNARLFISLHADADLENSNEKKSGVHIYIPSDTNTLHEQSELLGSALIGELKKDITIPVLEELVYLKKSAWVLKANPCPAVLIETGYLTNNTDLSFISSPAGQDLIAQNILHGIEKYLSAAPADK